MIHYIQEMSSKEVILNEVLVQYKASRIVERLHNRGIFIFDNEDDFKISGECIYEVLYPFVKNIIEVIPEEIMNKVILKEDYQSLEVIFGESINEYLIILNKLYSDFVSNSEFSQDNIDNYYECINKMKGNSKKKIKSLYNK